MSENADIPAANSHAFPEGRVGSMDEGTRQLSRDDSRKNMLEAAATLEASGVDWAKQMVTPGSIPERTPPPETDQSNWPADLVNVPAFIQRVQEEVRQRTLNCRLSRCSEPSGESQAASESGEHWTRR